MLKNKKRITWHSTRQLGAVEHLEPRQMLDGFGVVADGVDVEKYFPEYAAPYAWSPPDQYAANRVLNYAHYDGSLYSPIAYHPTGPDSRINEQETTDPEGSRSNNIPTDAEFIPLGFDRGEDDAIDVRGRLVADVEPTLVSSQEDDGSILLANETGLVDGTAASISATIGDVAYAGGDNDFYAIRDVRAGDFISVHVEGDLTLNPAVAIYNSLGNLIYAGDNTVIQVNGNFFLFNANADFVFEAPENDDYFVMVTGAVAQGFFAPLNPFDSESGLAPLSTGQYDATIGLNSADVDYYAVDLNAGDIIGVNALGRVNDLQLIAPDGTNIVGAKQSIPFTPYPDADSPLPTGGTSSVAAVAPVTGRYYVRALNTGIDFAGFQGINRGPGDYELHMRLFRPALEQQAVGAHQIIFLDFDGQTINTNIWDQTAGGPVDLSSMSTYLGGVGISSSRMNEVIDGIIDVFTENFRDVARRGNNGDFVKTGRNGEYRLEIRNSRDHKDPYGLPNVSRVIIGGSQAEFGIPTIGIAQSVDVGNFRTEETAVVLLDQITGPATFPVDLDGDGTVDGTAPNTISVNHYLTVQGKDNVDLFANVVGNIAAHEAGHYFGVWHTDNANEHDQLMDTGGDVEAVYETGPDRILGSQDDTDLDFGTDEFDPLQGFTGLEDSINTIAFGLSTGTGRAGTGSGGGSSATARGFVWRDSDSDGRIDVGEPGLANFLVYADENRNEQFDIGEPAARTDSSGNYRVRNISRSVVEIRVVTDPGFVITTPDDESHRFEAGVTTGNLNFGIKNGLGNDEGFDYGDAPSPYPTSGVRHGVVPGFSLGSTIDGESGPQADDGDDGVQFLTDVFPTGRATVRVRISNGDQSPGHLHGWIDFDGDGTWSTPGEKIFDNVAVTEGLNTLSFDVPSWAVESATQARFRYGYEPDLSFTGASIAGEVEDYAVNIERTGPDAIADTYEFRRNSGEHQLSVLSNDDVRAGTLKINSVTQPSSGGTVRIDGSGTTLIYKAAQDFSGTETFDYLVVDANGLTDTATVTVVITPDFASVRLVATNLDGSPVSRIDVGSDFLLQGFVQDLRKESPTGVYAAFMDVSFASNLATALGPISYGNMYPNDKSGFLDAGFIDEIGAIAAGVDRVGPEELLLFSVPLRADATGTINFIGSPADLSPAHDVLLFDSNEPIPTNQIAYGSYSVTITEAGLPATATNPMNAMDVNDDRSVSPIDALLVINELNGHAAAKPAGTHHFLDVSGDGQISPIDALLVINYLNRGTALAAVAGAVDQLTEPDREVSTARNPVSKPIVIEDQMRQRAFGLMDRNDSLFVENTVSDQARSEAIASVLDEMEQDLI